MEEIEVPKKKKGWPKGKPRGPRKPMEPLFEEPPPPVWEEPPPPVWVDGVMKDGVAFNFRCWSFDVSGTPWKFVSWAERRGRKIMTLVSPAEVSTINIEAPEEMFQPTPAQVAAAVTPQPVSSPKVEANPVMAQIRNRALSSGPRPKSEIVSDDGRIEIVDAVIT